MGYFTRKIAKESRTPAIVSLSSNSNYIQFESLNDPTLNTPVHIQLKVIDTSVDIEKTKIVIIESVSYIRTELIGTHDRSEVNTTTFFINENKSITASNIRDCLINTPFFRNNFIITIPPINDNDTIKNGDTLFITSINSGLLVMFNIFLESSFIQQAGNPSDTNNNDTISNGLGDTSIELEVFENDSLFLGVDDKPQNDMPLGVQIVVLLKSYFDAPIWFDLKSLMRSRQSFSNSFLLGGWSNTGTILAYRFIAAINNGFDKVPFYISNALYSITGYERDLEQNDLKEYVYDTVERNIIKPLTTQPLLTHIAGQTQYFNFILSDPDRNKNIQEYDLGINYRLYTQSKRFIEEVQAHSQNRKRFNIVNTLKLDIDKAIGDYDNVGIVEVYLSRSGSPVSEPMTFNILPKCLYKVNDFAFLNSLGGWSSFNFSGNETTDFKTSANTIFKTQTPTHTISSEIESVYSKEVTEQFIVRTMPITEIVTEWLKELSSSVAVYELSTKRYVIVDELAIKTTSKDDLFILEMKYHYSDSYNALIV